jgi:hypothetical protein
LRRADEHDDRTGRSVAFALVVALYLIWVAVTYLPEGRILTLQRPEAAGSRLAYALVANVLVGIGGAALVLRVLSNMGVTSPRQAGFRRLRHAVPAVVVGAALGFVLYAVQGPPTFNPVVIANAYAQVLVVSIAEILVCWAVVGSVSEVLLQDGRRGVASVLAGIVSSALFGAYHFAHSPPFNTIGFVALLTVIGFVTSLFFLVSRDVYGTIVFHNFAGILGVTRALESSGTLGSFERSVTPILVMAVVAVVLLIAAHVLLINWRHSRP